MSTAAKRLKEQINLLPVNGPVPNRRILVIDDEPEIARGIHRLLSPSTSAAPARPRSSRGPKKTAEDVISLNPVPSEFEVVVVHTPKDALSAVEKSIADNKPFAMGFFDIMLGADIDGIELVKQIFTIDPRLFAVFVTAYHDRNVDAIGEFLGLENSEKWDYINKPFTDGEILQKARNVTSLWDLHRLRDWQSERLDAAHQRLLENERHNTASALVRSVAHEFGNLLTHIIGRAELARNESDPYTMRQAFDVILKAGRTATDVLRSFRKLNDTGEKTSAHMPADFCTLLDEALEIMEFRFRRHAISVLKKSFPAVSPEVHRSSIIQVLVNLFINSIHAMPNGGRLHLSVETISGHVHFKVLDTGPGIPPDILPRVIEPLFTTKGTEGNGLGLSICKEIIEIDHHGEFKIENHPQGGVLVTCIVPIVKEENDDEEA